MVAVYIWLALNVASLGDHVIAPLYCDVSVSVGGVPPNDGALRGTVVMVTGAAAVAGNFAYTTLELALFVVCAPATLKKLAGRPEKV
jgi:hypothetical protein